MQRRAWIPFAVAAASIVVAALSWRSGGRDPARSPPAPAASARAASAPASAAPIEGAAITPEETRLTDDDAFRLLVFPVRLAGARLRVVDVSIAEESSRVLSRVLQETRASLVINAGFFDKLGEPEGLVIVDDVTLSKHDEALGGGVLRVSDGRASLAKAEGYAANASPPGTTFAIQARPRLVVDGASVIVKDDGRAAERTALCARDHGRALEVIVARGDAAGRGPTLALLADMLVSRGCEAALNLDGGPSTGVAWKERGEARALPPRGPIRQVITIHAARDEE